MKSTVLGRDVLRAFIYWLSAQEQEQEQDLSSGMLSSEAGSRNIVR